ncbi:type VI secretion system membrane subunit TssM [Sphingomonas sp. 3-13AW]|uniref:type VI secretion system membrane subunit TssM n=1 Tax=Sphingomonas sp. 3-13AW TaxID=3050450 RepID=UPI003BB79ABB
MDKLMRSWWALALPAALILGLAGQIGLPTLFPVLNSGWFRLGLIALIAIGLGGAAARRWWRARRGADALAAGLDEPSATDAEGSALAVRMREAIAQLKNDAGGGRDYLYARPWYMIIGPPGTGKTTALVNSGLRFPWSNAAVKGAASTRNLDFWFADQAVLVDTAGRYVTRDCDTVVDAAGWESFLRLLRQTRPLQPINGVIVALSTEVLMRADRAELDEHIGAIRRRLEELTRILQVTAPVYLLLPKADLIAGFTEYFEDLSAEGRRAVLGATLDPKGSRDTEALVAEFDAVAEALWARSPKRLQEEADARRRGLILAFPAQFTALRTRLAYVVEGIVGSERAARPMLRGFYFASGTQVGTPFDQVLNAMAEVYDAPQAAQRPGQGRAYFLNRLLTEVIIPEGGLVEVSARNQRRQRATLAAVIFGLGLAVLVMIGLWGTSFAHNKGFQNDLLHAAQEANEKARAAGVDLVEVRGSDPDLEQALPLLNRLRTLPHGYDAQLAGSPPFSMRLGLYQSGHADTARLVYLQTLQRVLLPRILLRAEAAMREQAGQPAQLYAPLKAYLMLGGSGPLDRQAVRAWVAEDWRTASLAGADRADVRAQLARHLDAMLADPDLGRAWQGRRAPLDGTLIASTRVALQSLPLAEYAYALLRQRAAATGQPDWRAETVLASGDAQAFRNGDAVLSATIPWFYTREGYVRAYRSGLRDVQGELDRDLWVLGHDASKRSIRDQIPAMRNAVAASYARDYIAAWDGLLALPQAADYFRKPAALGAITRTPSPLKVLLLETVRNTALASAGTPATGGQIDAGREIQAHFQGIAGFAGKQGAGDAPVDVLLKAVRQAAAANMATSAPGASLGGGAVQGQFATALGELSTASAIAPPQLKGFVDGATHNGAGAATRTARTALEQDYAANIRPACVQATGGRYPFVAAATLDASPAELHRLYGATGQFDSFSRERLAPLIQPGQVWRWNAADPVAAGFSQTSAAQFQKASVLRDLLTGGLALGVALDRLGQQATAVELSAGGVTYRFTAAASAAKPLLWNLAVLPAAQLVLFGGDREIGRIETRGSFALFRLMDRAVIENAGPSRIRARFGTGEASASFLVDLPSDTNPFGRGGPFSFRCPARL